MASKWVSTHSVGSSQAALSRTNRCKTCLIVLALKLRTEVRVPHIKVGGGDSFGPLTGLFELSGLTIGIRQKVQGGEEFAAGFALARNWPADWRCLSRVEWFQLSPLTEIKSLAGSEFSSYRRPHGLSSRNLPPLAWSIQSIFAFPAACLFVLIGANAF